ncbi:MAG: hypothetical protein ABSH47_21740 [Bryobacteraceae bacterium]|jgi:hypothetical protein
MACEWARFMWWLGQGQNAAAVQAITALVVTVLTVVLIGVTWFCAWKTGELTKLQLTSNFEPNVDLALTQNMESSGTGLSSLKLQSVHFVVRFDDDKYQVCEKDRVDLQRAIR